MSRPRVVAVAESSAAALAGLTPGDEFVSINGVLPRDVIEYQFLVEEPRVELEIQRGQFTMPVVIEKSAGSPLGVEVDSSIFDQVRTCDNHCSFCFIYQLPKGMRKSLYLKDDDYRLSFLYGNFTTLTRFTELDLERVIDERLSPLYVSIHATDPDVRAELLRNSRGAMSLRWLRALLDAGIEVHAQIVVCPGVNDGAVLYDTLTGVLDEYPELASVGVVPLGVSDYTTEPTMRPHTPAEVSQTLETIEEFQEIFLSHIGRRMVFASDEYYVLANKAFPDAATYEGFVQYENGVGIARAFIDELRGDSAENRQPHEGFFSWVDGAPAEGYRAPRMCGISIEAPAPTSTAPTPVQLRTRTNGPVTILTGSLAAPVLRSHVDELSKLSGVDVVVHEVENTFFGGNIGVAGLLTGKDIANALNEVPASHRVLLPDVCLSNGVFLDGLTLDDLGRDVEVVATSGMGLRRALENKRAA